MNFLRSKRLRLKFSPGILPGFSREMRGVFLRFFDVKFIKLEVMKKYEVHAGETGVDVLEKLHSLSKRFPKEAFFAKVNSTYIFPFDTKETYFSKVFDRARQFGGMNDNQQPEIPYGLLKEQLEAHPEYDYKSFAETWAFRYGENSYDALLNYLKDNQVRDGRLGIDIELTLLAKQNNYQYGENSEATNSLVVSAVRVVGDKIQGFVTESDDYVEVDLWEGWLNLDHSKVQKVLDRNPKLAEACMGLGCLGYGDVCFLLGGNDGEMQEIRRVLSENRIPYLDYDLGWGAKLSRYGLNTDSRGFGSTTFFAVELEDDVNMGERSNFHFIDHHGFNQDKPSSLEQVCRILDIPMTRHMELVAANDRGYIPAMLEIGATPEEIADIRLKDRAAQGITPAEEKAQLEALKNGLSKVGDLAVVNTPCSRFAPITDALYPQKRILCVAPNEYCFYGEGSDLVKRVADRLGVGFTYNGASFAGGGGEYAGELISMACCKFEQDGSFGKELSDIDIDNVVGFCKKELVFENSKELPDGDIVRIWNDAFDASEVDAVSVLNSLVAVDPSCGNDLFASFVNVMQQRNALQQKL